MNIFYSTHRYIYWPNTHKNRARWSQPGMLPFKDFFRPEDPYKEF